MNEIREKQNDFQNNTSKRRYVITAVIISLLIIAVLVFMITSYDKSSDPASEKIIRGVVGAVLSKDPNHLKNEDFQKVTALHLNFKKLSDIRLLEKFTNLEVLDLSGIDFPRTKIPKWKAFLAKCGINTFSEIHEYDLSPLKKLSKLQILALSSTPVRNIEPLANLTNLKVLKINGTKVSDLEPIKRLHSLQELHILGIKKSDFEAYEQDTNNQVIEIMYDKFSDEQLENLRKTLPNLKIIKAGHIFLE